MVATPNCDEDWKYLRPVKVSATFFKRREKKNPTPNYPFYSTFCFFKNCSSSLWSEECSILQTRQEDVEVSVKCKRLSVASYILTNLKYQVTIVCSVWKAPGKLTIASMPHLRLYLVTILWEGLGIRASFTFSCRIGKR